MLNLVFCMYAVFIFAQNSVEKTSLNILRNQKLTKNLNKSCFFSDTPIFISKNTTLSIQVENIHFNKDIFGEGLLHIANKPIICITPLVPITVAHFKVENTELQLLSKLQVIGRLKLVKANVLLNEYNLITEQKVECSDEVSNIIENSTGLWLKKHANITKSLPKNTQINNSNNVISALFMMHVKHINTLYIVAKITRCNTLYSYNYYQVPKPPPKFV